MTPPPAQKILIIRLGALGDLVLCAAQFQAIRQAYPQAKIALLTMPGFKGFTQQMPWLDDVIVDERPGVFNVSGWINLVKSIQAFAPDLVIDLQGKGRQQILYRLMNAKGRGIKWSGAVKGCTHPRPWPPQDNWHVSDFFNAQIASLGIVPVSNPDFRWLAGDLSRYELPQDIVAFIPGSSPDRLYKRWPASFYGDLAWRFTQKGMAVVAVGGKADADAVEALCKFSPAVINLCGATNLGELADLFRRCRAVVGNDTGPTHIAASVGTPTLALFSDSVNPQWSAPKGSRVTWLQGKPVGAITVDQAAEALAGFGLN